MSEFTVQKDKPYLLVKFPKNIPTYQIKQYRDDVVKGNWNTIFVASNAEVELIKPDGTRERIATADEAKKIQSEIK